MAWLSPHESGSLGVGAMGRAEQLLSLRPPAEGGGQGQLAVTVSKARVLLLSRTFLPRGTCLPVS